MAAPRSNSTPKPEKITASAGFSLADGDRLSRVVGDVVEALVAEGADLAKGITVKLVNGAIVAEGQK